MAGDSLYNRRSAAIVPHESLPLDQQDRDRSLWEVWRGGSAAPKPHHVTRVIDTKEQHADRLYRLLDPDGCRGQRYSCRYWRLAAGAACARTAGYASGPYACLAGKLDAATTAI